MGRQLNAWYNGSCAQSAFPKCRSSLRGALISSQVARPSVLFVGPARTGTSWVHQYLSERTDIALPRGVKELFFFDRRYRLGGGWYDSHFPLARLWRGPVVEVAPTLFACSAAIARVHEYLGDPRVIITLRDPVRRAVSHYRHLRRYGYTKKPFDEAARDFPEIVQASCYNVGVPVWKEAFSKVDIVLYDDLADSPEQFAEQLAALIGVPPQIPSVGLVERRVNHAAKSHSYLLAKLGNAAADLLRRYRMYGVVESAKHAGLKALFFGSVTGTDGKDADVLSADEIVALVAELSPQIDFVERATGRDLSAWHS